MARVLKQRRQRILPKIRREESNFLGFVGDGCGPLTLPQLGSGMVRFEDHRVLKAIQTPSARVQTGAENDELRKRQRGRDGAIEDHGAKLIEYSHSAKPSRIGRSAGIGCERGSRGRDPLSQLLREKFDGESIGEARDLWRERA